MRGASALQAVLSDLKWKDVRVFVVWEPVILTDVAPPTTGVLSRITDTRSIQFWDRSRLLSSALVRTARKKWRDFPQVAEMDEDTIIWDCVLIFPPGQRWEEEPPRPDFADGPVVGVIDAVRERLSVITESSGSHPVPPATSPRVEREVPHRGGEQPIP